ncbi:MAG: hypothetical protein RSD14_00890, partial [Clostridia bacterium]
SSINEDLITESNLPLGLGDGFTEGNYEGYSIITSNNNKYFVSSKPGIYNLKNNLGRELEIIVTENSMNLIPEENLIIVSGKVGDKIALTEKNYRGNNVIYYTKYANKYITYSVDDSIISSKIPGVFCFEPQNGPYYLKLIIEK